MPSRATHSLMTTAFSKTHQHPGIASCLFLTVTTGDLPCSLLANSVYRGSISRWASEPPPPLQPPSGPHKQTVRDGLQTATGHSGAAPGPPQTRTDGHSNLLSPKRPFHRGDPHEPSTAVSVGTEPGCKEQTDRTLKVT